MTEVKSEMEEKSHPEKTFHQMEIGHGWISLLAFYVHIRDWEEILILPSAQPDTGAIGRKTERETA